ncbi:MAG: hypothetical protein AAGG08_14915 [Actinomycetota bacterium]
MTQMLASALLPARNQMAFSLGWHIILACFGMAFPAMIFVLHRKGLKGDEVLPLHPRRLEPGRRLETPIGEPLVTRLVRADVDPAD